MNNQNKSIIWQKPIWPWGKAPLLENNVLQDKLSKFISRHQFFLVCEYVAKLNLPDGEFAIFDCLFKKRDDNTKEFEQRISLQTEEFKNELKKETGIPVTQYLCSLVSTTYMIDHSEIYKIGFNSHSLEFFDSFKFFLGDLYQEIIYEIKEELNEAIPDIEKEIEQKGNK